MAIVSRRGRRVENDLEDAESVMTAAAGGLRQRFMRKVASKVGKGSGSSDDSDESDEVDPEKADAKKRKTKKAHSNSNSSTSTEKEKEMENARLEKLANKKPSAAEEIKNQTEAEKKKKSLVQAAKLTQLEQAVPADAQMAPERVERVGLVSFHVDILLMSGVNSSLKVSKGLHWVSSPLKMCWKSSSARRSMTSE